ncbi:MAG: carbohydrate kinase [Verrucomicrobia bacterium]|nr:carbohydrate kinase [Verrucomicrobiota bacterium]
MNGISNKRLRQLLAAFHNRRVLVVGDVMLDHFTYGRCDRISPEAPVPIIEVTREEWHPGGAANTARNVGSLGGRATLIGGIGADDAGNKLKSLLSTEGVESENLLVRPSTPTIRKTRIIAQHQQLCRVDREQCAALTAAEAAQVVQSIRAQRRFDAIIICDYGKGFITQSLLDALKRLAPVVTLDPKPTRHQRLNGLTAMTPNRAETLQLAGRPSGDGDWRAAAEAVLKKWRPKMLLSTLGEQGMCLFQQGKPPHLIPTVAREVFDVSGAGDTAIAAFTLALASGATPVEAATISNHAAGVVVGKLGTATCTPDELRASFDR